MSDDDTKQKPPPALVKDQEHELKQAGQDEDKTGSTKRRHIAPSRRVLKNVSGEEEPEKTSSQQGERNAEADSDGSDSEEEIWDVVMEQLQSGQINRRIAKKILKKVNSKGQSGGTTDFLERQAAMKNQPFLLTMHVNELKMQARIALSQKALIKIFTSKVSSKEISMEDAFYLPILLDTDKHRQERVRKIMAGITTDCANWQERYADFNRQVIIPLMGKEFLETNGEKVTDCMFPLLPAYIEGCEDWIGTNKTIVMESAQIRGGGKPREFCSKIFKKTVAGGEPFLPLVVDPSTGQHAADAASLGPAFAQLNQFLMEHKNEILRLQGLLETQRQAGSNNQGNQGGYQRGRGRGGRGWGGRGRGRGHRGGYGQQQPYGGEPWVQETSGPQQGQPPAQYAPPSYHKDS